MHQPLECVEADQRAPGAAALDPHPAAEQKEENEQAENAKDRAGTDPLQRHLVKLPPLAPTRLLDDIGLGVGNRAAPLCLVELAQELLLVDGIGGRVDLLGAHRHSQSGDHEHGGRRDQDPDLRDEPRHGLVSVRPSSPAGAGNIELRGVKH